MSVLRVSVLGPPRVHHGDAPVVLSSAKASALLLYLAVAGETHPRATLAGLLWGGLPQDRARANLRLALMRLRRHLGKHITATSRSLALDASRDIWTDYSRLTGALAQPGTDLEAVRAAVSLYRGDFLDGLVLRDAAEFEEWAEQERARVRRLVATGLERLVADAQRRRDHEETVRLGRRLLELDPFAEHAHRPVMSALARMGRRAAALAQFETCRHVLEQELGVEPERATQELAQQIREAGDASDTAGDVDVSPLTVVVGDERHPHSQPSLARVATPLVGREAELARLGRLLSVPDSRLVTLVGPGGVGKTRLAIAAAELNAGQFADGVAHVSLTGLQTGVDMRAVDAIAANVLDALGLPLTGRRPPAELLVTQLAARDMLLLLDNIEHLPIAPLVRDVLAHCGGVTVLATSRRRIGLAAEWVVEVAGLAYPGVEDEAADAYASVALFAERARRLQPGFHLPEHRTAVARVCRLVTGLPLALELAAEWVRVLRPDAIADRLQASLDLLVTTSSVVAERHRSMRSVLESSWSLLDTQQQGALAGLSVFRGSFTAEAATAVAAAPLVVITELVEQSLVQREADGRLALHELVRQFSAERLAADPDGAAVVRARYAEHYAGKLRRLRPRLADVDDRDVVGAMEADVDNLAGAWQHTVDHGDAERMCGLLDDLWLAYRRMERFTAAVAALEQALRRADVTDEDKARWHRWAGEALHELGRDEESREHLHASLALLGRPVPTSTMGHVAGIAVATGRQVARRLSPRGRRPGRRPSRPLRPAAEAAETLSLLAHEIYVAEGDASILWALLVLADLGERSGEPHLAADAHVTMEGLTAAFGWHRLSRRYRQLGDPALAAADGAAVVLAIGARGYILLGAGAWDTAATALIRGRDLAGRSGQRRHWAQCHLLLAFVDRFRGRLEDAGDKAAAVADAARDWGDRLTLHWSLVAHARAQLRAPTADLDKLAALLDEDIRLLRDLPAVDVALGLSSVARLRLLQRQPEAAAVEAHRALELLGGVPPTGIRGLEAFVDVSSALLQLWREGVSTPNAGGTEGSARRAIELLARVARRVPIAEPGWWLAQGELAELEGRTRAAVRAYQRSRTAAERLAMPIEERRAQERLETVTAHPATSGARNSSA